MKIVDFSVRVSFFNYLLFGIIIGVLSISCLDFQFESEYEDINGITVEHIYSYYDLQGTKLRFNNDTGYIVYAESLLIYDFSEVTDIVYQGHYIAGSIIYDFQIYDNCAVLVTENGLEIVNISDSLPAQLSAMPLFFGTSIKIQDDNAYVISGTQLHVADISDKQNPTLTTSITFDHNITQIEVESDFVYVLAGTDLCVLDIRDPGSIILVASTSLHTLDIPHPERFFKKDTFVYIAGFTTFAAWLYTCEVDTHNTFQLSNSIVVPDRIRMFDASDEYTLAVSPYAAFLINLQYPLSPCIGEELLYGGIYGTIHRNYICILQPYIHIFEIRQVE